MLKGLFGVNSDLTKKKIWIITEMFYPDTASTGYIMTRIAAALSVDHDVHVICGPVGYDKFTTDAKEDFNFSIHRIKLFKLSKDSILQRLLKFILLSTMMFFKGVVAIKKKDEVLIVTNPAFIVPFYAFIKKLKRNRLTILVHDVFPENLIPPKIVSSSNNVTYRITKRVFDWAYKQADKIVVLGRDMLEVIKKKTNANADIVTIENWADVDSIIPSDPATNQLIIENDLTRKIVFTYAGNIGRVQGLDFLFDIIEQIENDKVHFLFIGGGALADEFKQRVSLKNMTSVTFIDALPKTKQNLFLNAAHVGLVTLAQDFYGLGVPSKTYNLMAAGKPVLFIGNKSSEIANMVIEQGVGYVFDENERFKMLDFFNTVNDHYLAEFKIKGAKARLLAETKYSEKNILAKFANLFKN